MEKWEKLLTFAMPFIKMLAILLIGHIIIKIFLKFIKKVLNRSKFDESLKKFIIKTTNIVSHVLIILSALNSIGISTTGVLAALSAAALAVAVALKDSLSNIAGGILLLISPRFATGDFIETSSESGTVLTVDLLHTTIKTPDNKQISIPNGTLINCNIINYSREPLRRVDITFSVAYENDVEHAKAIVLKVIKRHPLILNAPDAPVARVMSYGDSAVNIISRCWCNNENYWNIYFDLTEQVRAEFENEGISIPYNQLDVHIKER